MFFVISRNERKYKNDRPLDPWRKEEGRENFGGKNLSRSKAMLFRIERISRLISRVREAFEEIRRKVRAEKYYLCGPRYRSSDLDAGLERGSVQHLRSYHAISQVGSVSSPRGEETCKDARLPRGGVFDRRARPIDCSYNYTFRSFSPSARICT